MCRLCDEEMLGDDDLQYNGDYDKCVCCSLSSVLCLLLGGTIRVAYCLRHWSVVLPDFQEFGDDLKIEWVVSSVARDVFVRR